MSTRPNPGPPSPPRHRYRDADASQLWRILEKITISPGLTFDALVSGGPGARLVLLLHGFADSAATSIVKLREVVRREKPLFEKKAVDKKSA